MATNVLSVPWALWRPPGESASLRGGGKPFPHCQFGFPPSNQLLKVPTAKILQCFGKHQQHYGKLEISNQSKAWLPAMALEQSSESQRPTNMLTNHVVRQLFPSAILKCSKYRAGQGKPICLCSSLHVWNSPLEFPGKESVAQSLLITIINSSFLRWLLTCVTCMIPFLLLFCCGISIVSFQEKNRNIGKVQQKTQKYR